MTAYGHFMKQRNEYAVAMQAMMGCLVPANNPGVLSGRPSIQALQTKLIPPGGPSSADLTGGRDDGIMDYDDYDMEGDY